MQIVKHNLAIRLIIFAFLTFFTLAMLLSCSKNNVDVPTTNTSITEQTALNESSSSRQGNSIVAVPFEETFYVPCANEGAGENIMLTGKTNFVYQLRWNENGFSMVYHDNVRLIKGIGLSSEETFTGSGGTNGTVMGSWVNSQWRGTTIQRLRIIGDNTNFAVNYKYHITVTSDGTVTVDSEEESADCR